MSTNTGKALNMLDDNEIMAIDSPRDRVHGPYVVVHKDLEERWAIVAMHFDEKPTLGIRWFWGSGGTPFSRQATWFIQPDALQNAMLNRVCSSVKHSVLVKRFLAGEISGNQLKTNWGG